MDGEVMSDNSFFKPTLLYKEFMILDLIEKDQHITQREISKSIGVAVSMVNNYLNQYENNGLIKRKKHSTKTVDYFVTKKGMDRKKLLNIEYLHSSQRLYDEAKDNIVRFLLDKVDNKIKKLVLYGAGEVAGIIVDTIKSNNIDILIPYIIDDDVKKHGQRFYGIRVGSIIELKNVDYDAVMVSSYIHQKIIYNKLVDEIHEDKIISYF
jgi:DNA-binding MarR family transcriptional regulator